MSAMMWIRRIGAAWVCTLAVMFSACSAVRPVSAPSENSSDGDTGTVTVCIDPGHGFDDVGTDSDYLGDESEKDVTLRIALALAARLREQGIEVILTHDGESFPTTEEDDENGVFSPRERISYANTLDADCLISIHCDSYTADESVHGTRVYYSRGTLWSKKSASFAKTLKKSVDSTFPDSKEVLIRDMSVTDAFYVIRSAGMPSVLVEVGFVTNEGDAAKMLDPDWCGDMAEAMAEAIVQMFAE